MFTGRIEGARRARRNFGDIFISDKFIFARAKILIRLFPSPALTGEFFPRLFASSPSPRSPPLSRIYLQSSRGPTLPATETDLSRYFLGVKNRKKKKRRKKNTERDIEERWSQIKLQICTHRRYAHRPRTTLRASCRDFGNAIAEL